MALIKKIVYKNHCFCNYKPVILKLIFIYAQTLYAAEKLLKIVPYERAMLVEVLNYF